MPMPKNLVLTLAEPAYAGDVVLLSYAPGAAPIQDFGGNQASAQNDRAVENNASVQGNGIAVDADDNVYVAGYFEGAVKFGTHVLTAAGAGDAYLAKRNAAGVWQWARKVGSVGWVAASGRCRGCGPCLSRWSVRGRSRLSARKRLRANGAADLFVAKLDHDGNWIWAERAGGAPPVDPDTGIPGDGFNGLPFVEVANSVAVDGAGNVYVAGNLAGTATFGDSGLSITSTSAADIVVAKLNAAGAWQWAARAGPVRRPGERRRRRRDRHLCHGSDLGHHRLRQRHARNAGLFVAKLDANGVWQWADDGSSVSAAGQAVVTDGAGNIYVTGNNGLPRATPFVGKWNAAGASNGSTPVRAVAMASPTVSPSMATDIYMYPAEPMARSRLAAQRRCSAPSSPGSIPVALGIGRSVAMPGTAHPSPPAVSARCAPSAITLAPPLSARCRRSRAAAAMTSTSSERATRQPAGGRVAIPEQYA